MREPFTGEESVTKDNTDKRLEALSQWAGRALRTGSVLRLRKLAGDAGFRRYFRAGTEPPLVAVDSPPERTNPARFVAIADYLRRYGIHTPMVVAADVERGFMLLEDLGDKQLLGQLNDDSVETLYAEMLSELLCLQQIPPAENLLPCYSRELLLMEMRILPEWLANRLLGYSLDTAEEQLLEQTFALLLDSACEQPKVLVHRDYHSRNLMVRDGERPGVLDFQDAVWGPVTYDLASLLRDCYIRWPRERVEHWALTYAATAEAAGVLEPVQPGTFLRWFDWMGLQRHIKVLGLFPRLYLRDGKPGYLPDLPLVIRYTLEVSDRYPELRPFADWFRERLLPLVERQEWYRDYRSAGNR
ncbi:phosphotransferase [Microbulbifer thermotolerans]|uniref:Phosphotransferase n=1 Tax=Microbulbifer thermotolerans TaxID=252514 RepID=A0AB35I2W9_MICTH|nr:phosphotransferase [Microbulbifer thermotolerans]MCX2778377.1 phosphotransferase [Microbulbifer thermotolerans]MCX2784205.1 phosphotransferase [Microbulbifer thermotolerans]MCX2803013.1 phosphotransferase [Microbulbifer thermotolerans]MCX2804416.1 phosphotransferase [Microbulbifer thermotolerans]MCX2832564.1 phosphotransferase [Microbulbifer thermotolerans]